MATQDEVNFEETATPNFPLPDGRWAMIWMDSLVEVPSNAHSYQVPLYRWESPAALQEKMDEVAAAAEAAHPGCGDVKVVVSHGSGQWAGMAAIHAEGSR